MKTYDGEFVVVVESESSALFPTRPADILLKKWMGTYGGFGKSEVETTAGRLVSFFQSRGRWCKFNVRELFEYYQERGWDPNQMFFGLIGAWYDDGGFGGWTEPADIFIVFAPNGDAAVTDRFIERCYDNEEGRRKKDAA